MSRKIIAIFLVLWSVFNFNTVSAEGKLTVEDVERYLAPTYKEFEDRGAKYKVDLVVATPIANLNAKVDILGLDNSSEVCKLDYQIEILMLGKSKKEITIQQYMEQKGEDLLVYTLLDGQWTKQTIPNLKINEQKKIEQQAKERSEIIKSVELLTYNPEQIDLRVLIDTAKIDELVEKIILADKTSFKTPQEKTEFLDVYREFMSSAEDWSYTEHIDRVNKTIKTETDLSDLTRKIINTAVAKYDKKMKEKEKTDLANFLAASSVKINSEAVLLTKKEKIKVPSAVKKEAKELSLKTVKKTSKQAEPAI